MSADGYQARILALHEALGIPADYAASRGMTLFTEAKTVMAADRDPDGAEIHLAPDAGVYWQAMREAANGEGVVLLPYSGFRSVERQVRIIQGKREAGQSLAEVLRYVAAPGYSEHHTGRAIDIGTMFEPPLEERFAQTTAYRWLTQYAGQFGFTLTYPRGSSTGIGYEPWHWCWQA